MSEQPNSMANQSQNSLNAKDLMIPLSIVIAGLFVGAGLYFGGGSTVPAAAVPPQGIAGGQPTQPAQPADTTDQVAEVTDADHVKGDRSAPIMIVEYSDFDCPFCSRFHDSMNEIVANNPDVAWTYRHFPLEQLHPQAADVAVASECVAELGGDDAFWSFTDGYFEARGAGDQTAHGTIIPRLVSEAGVAEASFTECFESGRKDQDVQEDVANAVETGGQGTPWSILIGPSGKTYPINGALPASAVEQLIEVARQEA